MAAQLQGAVWEFSGPIPVATTNATTIAIITKAIMRRKLEESAACRS